MPACWNQDELHQEAVMGKWKEATALSKPNQRLLQRTAEYFRHLGVSLVVGVHVLGRGVVVLAGRLGREPALPRSPAANFLGGGRLFAGLNEDPAHVLSGLLVSAPALLQAAGGVGDEGALREAGEDADGAPRGGLQRQVGLALLRVDALGQGGRLTLALHPQPAVGAAEAAVLGGLALGQELSLGRRVGQQLPARRLFRGLPAKPASVRPSMFRAQDSSGPSSGHVLYLTSCMCNTSGALPLSAHTACWDMSCEEE